MTRHINADELVNELHKHFSKGFDGDEWWNSTHVLTAIKQTPTVDAIPVEYIEAEIKRMEDEIEHALTEYKHADGTVERMIARKAALEFILAKWRVERGEE